MKDHCNHLWDGPYVRNEGKGTAVCVRCQSWMVISEEEMQRSWSSLFNDIRSFCAKYFLKKYKKLDYVPLTRDEIGFLIKYFDKENTQLVNIFGIPVTEDENAFENRKRMIQ
jgi:hypothetical protein